MRLALALLFAALVAPAALAQPQEVRIGDFEYSVRRDPMDDTHRDFFGPRMQAAQNRSGIEFGFVCYDGQPGMFLGHKYLGGDDDERIMARFRVDDNPATDFEYFKLQEGNRASGDTDTEFVLRLIEQMRTGRRLRMRIVDPLDDETLDNSFSLAGFDRAITRLLSTCPRRLRPDDDF